MAQPNLALSARRISIADIAERITISWIEKTATPPVNLASLVGQYRDLVFYIDNTEDQKAAAPIAATMDRIYDYLIAAAIARQRAEMEQIYMRLERQTKPFQQQCNEAIAQWRAGRQAS